MMAKVGALLLLLFSATFCFAQSEFQEVQFEHVTIPGSIQSSQVNDLIVDGHGLIWIAGDGLQRYDGYKFTDYKTISPTQGLAGQEIICLFFDKHRNKLLLGTHSYGIVEYSYDSDAFRIVPSKGGVPIVSMITQTNDGTIWAGSFTTGVFMLKNDTLRKIGDPKRMLNLPTSMMAINNKVLVDRLKTVYVLKDGVISDSIKIEYPGVTFPFTTRVTAMSMAQDGKIWMGTEREGVVVYDTLQKKITKYLSPERAPFYHRINKIMTARNGDVWILTKANGVAIYSPKTETITHLTKDLSNERSLSGNNCTAIAQDHSGIIWIGSTGDLNKYDPDKIQFKHIYNNPYSKFSLNDNMVRSIYEDRFENLWVGTDGGIVHIIDTKKSTIEKIPLAMPGATQHVVGAYFHELTDNLMLIGTSIGILQYDRTTKKLSVFKPLENETGRLVRQILRQGDELFYIHSGSLYIYNIRSKELKRFSEFGAPTIKNATAIFIDSKNRLWVGAMNGVAHFNREKETFTHIQFQEDKNRPVGTYFMVLSIYEFNNKLWVGSFNAGLWIMDLEDITKPVIKTITQKDGLPNNTIYSTLPDSKGNLWMSTNEGISKYDIANNQFTNFTSLDGLQHEEFNRLAYVKRKNGELVFGGINGLNLFSPENIKLENEQYIPAFIGVTRINKNTNQFEFRGLLGKSTLQLKNDERDVEFMFFVPNYKSPRPYEVYYKLEGYNADWIKAQSNSVFFANLPPGNYTMMLKTKTGKGVEHLTSLSVEVAYPLWLKWWFVLLMIGLIIGLIFTIIKINILKTKRDKERLELLLKIRTQEIEKSREELAVLNEKKDIIFSILSHDLRSPLTTLKGFLSILIDSEDLSKEDIKKHASNIRNSVTSSLDLIDNTLFWSMSQTGNITYTPSTFNIGDVLHKVTNLYQLTAEKKQIKFAVSCEENILLYADENMFYVTLRNLVSNALKFTPEGKNIQITATKQEDVVEIRIKDEGIGMSDAYMRKLLHEEHLQLKKGTSNEKGTGLGIALCKKFIQLNKGELIVKSEEGKGSEFIVRLPILKAAS